MHDGDAALVSVVIPTRNRCHRLSRALASAREQTWGNLEIIVVDDGSSDGTPEMLRRLSAEDSRVHVVRNDPAVGGAAARNRGIEAARGRWIAFLDDDDRWLPHKVERQLAMLQADDRASAVSCAYYYKARFRKTTVVPVAPVDAIDVLLVDNRLGGASVCMAAADTLRAIGGFDPCLRGSQDWDLWLRLAERGPVLACDEPLAFYDSHHGERISRNFPAAYAGRRRLFLRYRARMTAGVRRHHLTTLILMRRLLGSPSARRDVVMLRRVYAIGGARDGLRCARWYLAVRVAGGTGRREQP